MAKFDYSEANLRISRIRKLLPKIHSSEIAKPLNDLLKKDQKFEWTTDCQKAFEELKKRFIEELVLTMPDHKRPFQIECDASKYASGAILTQLDSNGDRHPCAYISKTFSPAERKDRKSVV